MNMMTTFPYQQLIGNDIFLINITAELYQFSASATYCHQALAFFS